MQHLTCKRCMCGGLIVSMLVGGVVVETCEHGAGASACSMPSVEYLHAHFPEPQGPIIARQPHVLGTATDTRVGLVPRFVSVSPQYAAQPNASFVRPSV